MQSKKVLVTGGAGYIGSHTVVELFQAGYNPIIIDNFSNSEKSVLDGINKIIENKVKWYEVDCRNADQINNIFLLEKPVEGVIHFAAAKAVGESVENPLKYYDNNINSLSTILYAMKKADVNRMVFSSSCTVYGQAKKLPVTEKSPILAAQSPYGNTKQICEEILRDLAIADKHFQAILLRYFNPVGAHPSSLIGELPIGVPGNLVPFITQVAVGIRNKLTVFGNDYDTVDGTCVRDFIHVVDLAKAHVKALNALFEGKVKHSMAINCGTGAGHSVLELIKCFEKISGQKFNYEIGARRAGDVEAIYANVNKSREILNWETKFSLEEALRDAFNWQKQLAK